MARYIDADILIEALTEEFEFEATLCTKKENMWFKRGINCAIRNVDRIPTADVEEVKHGEWIEDGYSDCPCVCSYCGEEAQYISRFEETFDYDWEENLQSTGYEEIREYIRTPYCPNCGTKMDEPTKIEHNSLCETETFEGR